MADETPAAKRTMSDGGDDAAASLSQAMEQVRDALCVHYNDEAQTRRIHECFRTKLRTAQLEEYSRLPDAYDEEEEGYGAVIEVFPPDSQFYLEDDPLLFNIQLNSGQRVSYQEVNYANEPQWGGESTAILPHDPNIPYYTIEYRNNIFTVYRRNDHEDDGGDTETYFLMAAFVDLCA